MQFHLAFPVHDLAAARSFYGETLGLREGRSSDTWVDWDFHGHQIVTHLVGHRSQPAGQGQVDGVPVPVPHFGLILTTEAFAQLAARLERANVEFVIAPTVRYRGKRAEQATMFLLDPSGNALEFKAYTNPEEVFTPEPV
ncbi:MAG: VOC family protein [Candidatus Eremiobacteraeota bacterium]|nr:VOC family protein [Candidatus Eremiobacteraeota bacterium]